MKYVFYTTDCESSGLDAIKNDVIELSLYRMGADPEVAQKTWFIKPINLENIEHGALRVNGHKMEDLKGYTQFGRDTYRDAKQVIIEVENWLACDEVSADNRVLIGQNVGFDKAMLEQLWLKCGASDSFPFGRRYLDTMQIALMMDYVNGQFSESYSLSSLIKRYGIKNDRAHSAAADTRATKALFEKQVEELRKKMDTK